VAQCMGGCDVGSGRLPHPLINSQLWGRKQNCAFHSARIRLTPIPSPEPSFSPDRAVRRYVRHGIPPPTALSCEGRGVLAPSLCLPSRYVSCLSTLSLPRLPNPATTFPDHNTERPSYPKRVDAPLAWSRKRFFADVPAPTVPIRCFLRATKNTEKPGWPLTGNGTCVRAEICSSTGWF
jgi:hypothetical protein